MVKLYDFPAEHRRHLRTTNVVESPSVALRLRTDATQLFKRVGRTIAVILKADCCGEWSQEVECT